MAMSAPARGVHGDRSYTLAALRTGCVPRSRVWHENSELRNRLASAHVHAISFELKRMGWPIPGPERRTKIVMQAVVCAAHGTRREAGRHVAVHLEHVIRRVKESMRY